MNKKEILASYQLNDLTDKELIILAKNNPEVFGILIERYQGQLFHYIRRLTQLSQDDIDDLLQEIFIKIYQKLNEYDLKLKFSSWAYRIAHNHIIDYFRKINARPKTNRMEDYEWDKIVFAGFEIEKELIDKDCMQKIKQSVQNLPIKYREILILRFLEEKSYEEIMHILKKPKGSIATLVARGRKKLKQDLIKNKVKCF